MTNPKKCVEGGKTSGTFIEKESLNQKKYFCSEKCFGDYKKKGEEQGMCEFC